MHFETYTCENEAKKRFFTYIEISWATFLFSLSNLQKISTVQVKALSFSWEKKKKKCNDDYVYELLVLLIAAEIRKQNATLNKPRHFLWHIAAPFQN